MSACFRHAYFNVHNGGKVRQVIGHHMPIGTCTNMITADGTAEIVDRTRKNLPLVEVDVEAACSSVAKGGGGGGGAAGACECAFDEKAVGICAKCPSVELLLMEDVMVDDSKPLTLACRLGNSVPREMASEQFLRWDR